MIVEGCPALSISDEIMQAWELFHLAHSAIPDSRGYLRQVSFSDLMNLPMWIVEVWRVIESELHRIRGKL